MDAWTILLPALAMSTLMLISHTYLGLHVLARGIIFIDLALAQIAALGMSIAFLLGEEAHGLTAQLYAFAATLIAAFAFASLRRIKGKTTREVIIGCSYIVTTALSIMILSQTAQGMEELKSLFNGKILFASWDEIGFVAIIYLLLTILHWIYRKQFIALSFNSKQSTPGFLWEVLFFVSFAIVITLAVNIAGILLVFACLIIPAFSATLLSNTLASRLIIGWILGFFATLGGLWLSYTSDLPTGATVVIMFGILPVVSLIIKKFQNT
ncbi:MAG: metal ABC transporter permease [Gammaproteobacteria bacterium]|nr:metal ABC transporter permease [Gammaproteobacteria bacterium]